MSIAIAGVDTDNGEQINGVQMLHRHDRLNFPSSLQFVTTVTLVRGKWFVEEDVCCEVLRVFEWYRAKNEVECYGYVLMPDHLHALLRQNCEHSAISKMIGAFKSYTSRHLKLEAYPEKKLWRDYFDSVPVPGVDAQRTKLKYIHQNPVRKQLVERSEDYPWSSARCFFFDLPPLVSLFGFANAGERPVAIASLETHNGARSGT